jgi:CRP-like cAMP-binding protein
VRVSQHGRAVRECGPGESVGEIALLRDVPRTASVQAMAPVEALALARDDFLEAVTGHPASRLAADAVVSERLAT